MVPSQSPIGTRVSPDIAAKEAVTGGEFGRVSGPTRWMRAGSGELIGECGFGRASSLAAPQAAKQVTRSGDWRRDFKRAKSNRLFRKAVTSATCSSSLSVSVNTSNTWPTFALVGDGTSCHSEHGKTRAIGPTATLTDCSPSFGWISAIAASCRSTSWATPSLPATRARRTRGSRQTARFRRSATNAGKARTNSSQGARPDRRGA